MTEKTPAPLPLSRPVAIADIPERGLEIRFEASAEERAAVAAWLDAPAVESLTADYTVLRRGSQVRLDGRVAARLVRICGVTLEPFTETVEEPVAMRFSEHASPDGVAEASVSHDAAEEDLPDPIVNGRIDIGAVTAEFLALGLDPYPRKPGVDFAYAEDAARDNPFAALAALKPPKASD